MNRIVKGVVFAASTCMSVTAATAQHQGHSAAPAPAPSAAAASKVGTPSPVQGIPKSGPPTTEASKAYEAAAQKMHHDMSSEYTNDVDVDFVRGMIPHHQGAIDQAEILLKHSKNPRLRRLAGGIIASQRREIRFMQKWLKDREQGIEGKDMPAWLRSNPDTAEAAKLRGDKE